ncbi:MAG: hypothetical protein Q9163_004594 [Psora crenata]
MDAPHHRKIDLQSAADLTYLLKNIQAAAHEKIDLAIPPSAAPAGEEDAYRTKVVELVQDYIVSTLSLALPSLTINGFDASPSLLPPLRRSAASNDNDNNNNNNTITATTTGGASTAATATATATSASSATVKSPASLSDAEIAAGNYEPYDPRLAEKLRNLYVQFEQEAEMVARMRREVPAEAARGYAQRLDREMEAEAERGVKEKEEEEEEEEKGKRDGDGDGNGNGVKVEDGGSGALVMPGLWASDRTEHVESMWRRGVEGLSGLTEITTVLARLERANKAVEVVEGM